MTNEEKRKLISNMSDEAVLIFFLAAIKLARADITKVEKEKRKVTPNLTKLQHGESAARWLQQLREDF